jgi:hypothetical protein
MGIRLVLCLIFPQFASRSKPPPLPLDPPLPPDPPLPAAPGSPPTPLLASASPDPREPSMDPPAAVAPPGPVERDASSVRPLPSNMLPPVVPPPVAAAVVPEGIPPSGLAVPTALTAEHPTASTITNTHEATRRMSGLHIIRCLHTPKSTIDVWEWLSSAAPTSIGNRYSIRATGAEGPVLPDVWAIRFSRYLDGATAGRT